MIWQLISLTQNRPTYNGDALSRILVVRIQAHSPAIPGVAVMMINDFSRDLII